MYRKTVQERTAKLQAHTYGVKLGSVSVPVGVQDSVTGNGWLLSPSLHCQLRLHRGVKKALWGALRQFLQAQDPPVDVKECDVKLFTGLAVSAQGSSQRIIYHANPSLKDHPWYDDVLLLDDEDEEGEPILHSGRLRAIVNLSLPDDGGHLVMLFVHAFCAATTTTRKRTKREETPPPLYEPARNHHSKVPFPYMRFAYKPNGEPVYWLVESETLSSGVWVQEDFDNPGNYFFIQ